MRARAGVTAAVAAVVVVALTLAVGAAGAARGKGAVRGTGAVADTAAYTGLGAWLDVFDTDLRRNAAATVARFQAAGVTTVFLETSSWTRTYDLQAPELTGPFLDAAHASGIKVVAWYLPGFQNVSLDVRRSLAAVTFRSVSGGAFDGLALDIEDTTVKDAAARTKRLLL